MEIRLLKGRYQKIENDPEIGDILISKTWKECYGIIESIYQDIINKTTLIIS